jgi:hypothetical protein
MLTTPHLLAHVFKKEPLHPVFRLGHGAMDMIHIDRSQRVSKGCGGPRQAADGHRHLGHRQFPEGTCIRAASSGVYKSGGTIGD